MTWITPAGKEMQSENWSEPEAHCLGVLLDGRAQATGIRRRGSDLTILIIVNSYHDVVGFQLPRVPGGHAWTRIVDTNLPDDEARPRCDFGDKYDITGRSLLLFELELEKDYQTARDNAVM